jgi:hypothetical protein
MSPAPIPPTVVMHRAALLAAGFTDDEIRRNRRSGLWQSVHRGAYCPSSTLESMPDHEKYRLRVVAAATRSQHLVVSHQSAAILLGLPVKTSDLDTVHLIRRGTSGGRSANGRTVRSALLEPEETVLVNGVLVTSVARTLVDLGCTASRDASVMAADYALHLKLVTPAGLSAAMARTVHRPGGAAARRALRFADGRSESPGESTTRVILDEVALPAPHLQVTIYGPNGEFYGRTDLGYPESAVLLEFDGYVKYSKLLKDGESSVDVVVREKDRENLIRGMGYLVVRIVWADLYNPALLAERIRANLERGRRIVAAGGLTGSWAAAKPIRII